MDIKDLTAQDFQKLINKHGSGKKAAKAFGVADSTFRKYFGKARASSFTHRVNVQTRKIGVTGENQYFILSSAQDGTSPDEYFLPNLKAYASFLGAEILISGYTYAKNLFENHGKSEAYFHEDLVEYMTDERVLIGTDLVFCGEMNTLPTAVNPLSGFHNYTGKKLGIFPHPKVQLESVPTIKGDPAKLLITTGSITKPNYVKKKAGIKAEYHHIIGAVIVEVKPDGTFFARHILAEKDGSFYDLDRRIADGVVSIELEDTVEAITYGDIHTAKLDKDIAYGTFGYDFMRKFYDDDSHKGLDRDFNSLTERLNPKHVFFHDVLDFEVRNHHNIADHIHRFRTFDLDQTVENEIKVVAAFLQATKRPNCVSVVVESNHDLAFEKWLKTADYKNDPANAVYFLKNQIRLYENSRDKSYGILNDAMEKDFLGHNHGILFLRTDDDYCVLEHIKGGIECGIHGHNGPNGVKGNYKQFAKVGVRCNTAHQHSGGIYEGVYMSGVMGLLHGYNVGPSNWTFSHVIVYKNSKRALVTMNQFGEYTTFD